MNKVKVTFETITPLWTGNAWQENVKIRPSSIIGSLRFWFEIFCYFSGIETKSYKDEKELDYKKFIKYVRREDRSENIFIELDEKAKEIWQKFLNLKKIKNVFERRKEFKKIKAEFYDYVISLRYPDKADLPPPVEGFRYVNYEQLEDYYDKNTGYSTTDILMF